MKTFVQFLTEKLITFGGKAYPKFGNVVILAGGAGSGKGFQKDKLLGIEGKVFDVDALKQLAVRAPKFVEKVKQETGNDLSKFDMKTPSNVSKIHEILSDVYNITDKSQQASFSSIILSAPDRKPNLIFDVTLSALSKLESISRNVEELGYDKKNIHLIWIVNDISVAVEQNAKRSRVVPEEILIGTHEGAALTMKKIIDMDDKLKKYMDGDIYLSFNKSGVDTKTVINKSGELSDFAKENFPNAKGGFWVKEANYIRIKKQGKPQLSSEELSQELVDKIAEYTPKINTWK